MNLGKGTKILISLILLFFCGTGLGVLVELALTVDAPPPGSRFLLFVCIAFLAAFVVFVLIVLWRKPKPKEPTERPRETQITIQSRQAFPAEPAVDLTTTDHRTRTILYPELPEQLTPAYFSQLKHVDSMQLENEVTVMAVSYIGYTGNHMSFPLNNLFSAGTLNGTRYLHRTGEEVFPSWPPDPPDLLDDYFPLPPDFFRKSEETLRGNLMDVAKGVSGQIRYCCEHQKGANFMFPDDLAEIAAQMQQSPAEPQREQAPAPQAPVKRERTLENVFEGTRVLFRTEAKEERGERANELLICSKTIVIDEDDGTLLLVTKRGRPDKLQVTAFEEITYARMHALLEARGIEALQERFRDLSLTNFRSFMKELPFPWPRLCLAESVIGHGDFYARSRRTMPSKMPSGLDSFSMQLVDYGFQKAIEIDAWYYDKRPIDFGDVIWLPENFFEDKTPAQAARDVEQMVGKPLYQEAVQVRPLVRFFEQEMKRMGKAPVPPKEPAPAEPERKKTSAAQPEPEAPPEPPSSDGFEVRDGVLIRYTGPGGTVVVPEDVTEIGKRAFEGCSTVTDVVFPQSLRAIGDYAFLNCRFLQYPAIPDGVAVGKQAFTGTANPPTPERVSTSKPAPEATPERVSTPSYLYPELPERVSTPSWLYPELPERVTWAYIQSGKLVDGMRLQDEVTVMEVTYTAHASRYIRFDVRNRYSTGTLNGTRYLHRTGEEVYASWPPDSPVAVDEYYVLPSGFLRKSKKTLRRDLIAAARRISDQLDAACERQEGARFVFPDGVVEIAAAQPEPAEPQRMNPPAVQPEPEAPPEPPPLDGFEVRDGVLIRYTGPGGTVVVPDGVTEIGKRAFEGCSRVTDVVLPQSLRTIGDYAFLNCRFLQYPAIPERVTIGKRAFLGTANPPTVGSTPKPQAPAELQRKKTPAAQPEPEAPLMPPPSDGFEVREDVPVRSASHGRYHRFRVPYPSDPAAPLTVEVWTVPCLHYLGSARSAGRTQPAEGWLPIPPDFFLWRPQEEIERSLDALLASAEDGRLITGRWSGQAHKELRQLLQGRDVFRMAMSDAPELSDAVELLSFSRTVSLEGPLRDQKPYRLYVSRENDRMYLSWIGAECGTWSEWPDPEERKCVPLPADFFDRPVDQIEKALRWAAEMIGYAPQELRFRDDFAEIVTLLRSSDRQP